MREPAGVLEMRWCLSLKPLLHIVRQKRVQSRFEIGGFDVAKSRLASQIWPKPICSTCLQRRVGQVRPIRIIFIRAQKIHPITPLAERFAPRAGV